MGAGPTVAVVGRPESRLRAGAVVLRAGTGHDAEALHLIRGERFVAEWWGPPEPVDAIAAELAGESDDVVYVVEVAGAVAGAVQYTEELEPQYRHAGIDLYLGQDHAGRGLGSAVVALVAAHLIDVRGHHRLTIDPAAANARAIACYRRVGFRPVGLLRCYERGADGVWHDGLLMDLLAAELVRDHVFTGRRGTSEELPE